MIHSIRGIVCKTLSSFSDLLEAENPTEIINANDNTETTISDDGFILTLDNFLSINPMIGIKEEDIKEIFK